MWQREVPTTSFGVAKEGELVAGIGEKIRTRTGWLRRVRDCREICHWIKKRERGIEFGFVVTSLLV